MSSWVSLYLIVCGSLVSAVTFPLQHADNDEFTRCKSLWRHKHVISVYVVIITARRGFKGSVCFYPVKCHKLQTHIKQLVWDTKKVTCTNRGSVKFTPVEYTFHTTVNTYTKQASLYIACATVKKSNRASGDVSTVLNQWQSIITCITLLSLEWGILAHGQT